MLIRATAVQIAAALGASLVASAGAAQETRIPPDTLIRLERTACSGPWPIYSVEIDAGGTVTYDGQEAVRVVGRRTVQIAPSVVATLLASVGRIGYFELRDEYRFSRNPDGTSTTVTDGPAASR